MRTFKSLIGATLMIFPLLFSGCDQATSATPPDEKNATSNVPAVIEVAMQNMQFSPAKIEIKKGDTIKWTNKDVVPHTATSSSFDSGAINPGASWEHTFTETGEIPYACTYHPPMTASITVK